jgi:hypothetical protein
MPSPFEFASEAGWECVSGYTVLELLIVGVEAQGAHNRRRLVLAAVRIGHAALDRAHRLARFVIIEADALGAHFGIDPVGRFPALMA